MKIGERAIGTGSVYVIAEVGVNHDGDAGRAVELTEAAAWAGADAVKFQYFETDRLMSRAAKLAAYQKAAGETDPVAMLRRLELPLGALGAAMHRAHALGIHAIVTVFSVELVAGAAAMPWDAFKSASPDLVNKPLLSALAAAGRPMIVSTGAADLDEVTRASGWLAGCRDRLAMLQCVSSYPAPEGALGGIGAIHHATGLPTGYSDHTPGLESGADAVRAGAMMLEKHLTYDCGAAGPDHAASLEPEGMQRYVRLARLAALEGREPASGGAKRVLACERDVRLVSRQSVVAVRDLAPGQVVTAQDVTIKRPGTGVPAWRLDDVIGRRVLAAVGADEPVPLAALGLAAAVEAA